jgi:hypothetical protein
MWRCRTTTSGRPLNAFPLAVVFIAAVALTVIALLTKRGAELPRHADVVEAEEVHGSPFWALVFAVLTTVELGVIAVIPLNGLRWVMTLPVLLLLGAAALAWSGFHYRFTGHGIEISTLGFRLRSIPLQNIRAYAVAPWSPMGGYGIRGIGERRAYVWGNTGVRIMLSDGEVFLGHCEPEKIMNDLNLIRQNHVQTEPESSRKYMKRTALISSCSFAPFVVDACVSTFERGGNMFGMSHILEICLVGQRDDHFPDERHGQALSQGWSPES